jgi:hypothetical protein
MLQKGIGFNASEIDKVNNNCILKVGDNTIIPCKKRYLLNHKFLQPEQNQNLG